MHNDSDDDEKGGGGVKRESESEESDERSVRYVGYETEKNNIFQKHNEKVYDLNFGAKRL